MSGLVTGPVLVTGGSGQLGRWLAHLGGPDVVAVGRDQLDLTRPEGIDAVLDAHRPRCVVGAAAFTAVDAAESNEAAAAAVNRDGAGALAAACARRGIPLLHVSTDYVFAGRPAGPDPRTCPPLPADTPTEPLGAYGRTKAAGERAVRAAHPEALIVRTAWVYTGPARRPLGLTGGDFVTSMLDAAAAGRELRVVDDQIGSPTHAGDLAAGLLEAARRLAAGPELRGRVLHAVGGGRASWFDMARAALAAADLDPGAIAPCTSAEFPRPAPRPAFSVLSTAEWAAAGLTPLRPWERAVAAAVRPDPASPPDSLSS